MINLDSVKLLYTEHLTRRLEETTRALASLGYQSLVLGSGHTASYFEDDSAVPFRINPHFAAYCPAMGPHHLLHIEPGKKPHLIYFLAEDFWHKPIPFGNPFWNEDFTITIVNDRKQMWAQLGPLERAVFIGSETAFAQANGVKVNCDLLMARLNWCRRYKSDYEIECLSQANRLSAPGHKAAYQTFLEGGSEYQIHTSYLNAMQAVDADLPYPGIVALNQNAATLHYQGKEHHQNQGRVLLIDSGAQYLHYASDITRTYATNTCHPIFQGLLTGLKKMQKNLYENVRPGLDFPLLHRQCHAQLAHLLKDLGIIGMEPTAAVEQGLTKSFLPHGLGHMLGVQVHDIGGKQMNEQGDVLLMNPAYKDYHSLRFVGTLEPRMVVTIEPGIYFIPALLNKLRQEPLGQYVDWTVVDAITPLGGIRVEDDLLVTEHSFRNLTREFLED